MSEQPKLHLIMMGKLFEIELIPLEAHSFFLFFRQTRPTLIVRMVPYGLANRELINLIDLSIYIQPIQQISPSQKKKKKKKKSANFYVMFTHYLCLSVILIIFQIIKIYAKYPSIYSYFIVQISIKIYKKFNNKFQ